jgi:hypothetical protein
MKRGQSAVKRFRAAIGKAVATVTRFAKRIALVGLGAMVIMIKKSLQTIDVVSKLSRRIGIATEELLALRHAAELAGVTNQALDKSLEIFVRRMGEVKSGSGEATRGLEALGLSAEKMIALTPEKAMLVIADRIQELGTQAEKSAAAYFLFGRSGAQLLNLFEKGSEGIKKATDEARKLGLTLEGFDLTKVEDANDAMTKFKSAISAVFLELTVNISPALKNLADLMTKNRDRILQTAKNAVIFSVKLLASIAAIKAVIGIVRVLISTMSLLIGKQVIAQALAGPAGWALLATSIGVATAAIISLNRVIDNTIEGIKNIGTEAKKLSGVWELPKTVAETENQVKSLTKTLTTLKLKALGAEGTAAGGVFKTLAKGAASKLKDLKRNLTILKREEATQKRIAAIEKRRFEGLATLMGDVKREASNIIKFVFDKLPDLSKTTKEAGGGRFQQIRSAFIDVAALNPAKNPTTELQLLNKKTERSNQLLEQLNLNAIGVFPA